MKKIFLITLLAIPGFLLADIEIKEGFSVNGSISATRGTPKYASVEKCNAYADSRSKVIAFTYNSKKDNYPCSFASLCFSCLYL